MFIFSSRMALLLLLFVSPLLSQTLLILGTCQTRLLVLCVLQLQCKLTAIRDIS